MNYREQITCILFLKRFVISKQIYSAAAKFRNLEVILKKSDLFKEAKIIMPQSHAYCETISDFRKYCTNIQFEFVKENILSILKDVSLSDKRQIIIDLTLGQIYPDTHPKIF